MARFTFASLLVASCVGSTRALDEQKVGVESLAPEKVAQSAPEEKSVDEPTPAAGESAAIDALDTKQLDKEVDNDQGYEAKELVYTTGARPHLRRGAGYGGCRVQQVGHATYVENYEIYLDYATTTYPDFSSTCSPCYTGYPTGWGKIDGERAFERHRYDRNGRLIVVEDACRYFCAPQTGYFVIEYERVYGCPMLSRVHERVAEIQTPPQRVEHVIEPVRPVVTGRPAVEYVMEQPAVEYVVERPAVEHVVERPAVEYVVEQPVEYVVERPRAVEYVFEQPHVARRQFNRARMQEPPIIRRPSGFGQPYPTYVDEYGRATYKQ